MTNTEPKYKVGQIVYTPYVGLACNAIAQMRVSEVERRVSWHYKLVNGIAYTEEEPLWRYEDKIFPTLEACAVALCRVVHKVK